MVNICSTCGKSFKHSSSLSRHRTNVHKDKEFKCDVCQEQLSSKCCLDRHRRVKHNISGKFEYVPYVKKRTKIIPRKNRKEWRNQVIIIISIAIQIYTTIMLVQ